MGGCASLPGGRLARPRRRLVGDEEGEARAAWFWLPTVTACKRRSGSPQRELQMTTKGAGRAHDRKFETEDDENGGSPD